jgi:hypothetical protein
VTDAAPLDLFRLDDAIWVANRRIDSPTYDFAFDRFFPCRRPYARPDVVTAVGRLGALPNYEEDYARLIGDGVRLINSPAEHALASELPLWYPHVSGYTPRSEWFDTPPPRTVVEERFGWPVFVKGARQTARHSAELCIARSGEAYNELVRSYAADPILGWQKCVIREHVSLRPVAGDASVTVPPSFEFRTFWLHGKLVGAGPYWAAAERYDWDPNERSTAIALASRVVAGLSVPFIVVDLAQTVAREWIVIECNDAQESGHAGVSPFALWSEIIRVAHEGGPE